MARIARTKDRFSKQEMMLNLRWKVLSHLRKMKVKVLDHLRKMKVKVLDHLRKRESAILTGTAGRLSTLTACKQNVKFRVEFFQLTRKVKVLDHLRKPESGERN